MGLWSGLILDHGIEPFGFHKVLGNSCVFEQILAPQEGFSFRNLVN